jgi:transcriptional regulator with XRE-family HTH domain
MQIDQFMNNTQVLTELGARLRDVRVAKPLTRDELSQASGVSVRTIANIEGGKDVTFGNVLSVMRALGLLQNANALVAEQTVRPSDLAALSHKRQRAMSAKYRKQPATAWVWGEDK